MNGEKKSLRKRIFFSVASHRAMGDEKVFLVAWVLSLCALLRRYFFPSQSKALKQHQSRNWVAHVKFFWLALYAYVMYHVCVGFAQYWENVRKGEGILDILSLNCLHMRKKSQQRATARPTFSFKTRTSFFLKIGGKRKVRRRSSKECFSCLNLNLQSLLPSSLPPSSTS